MEKENQMTLDKIDRVYDKVRLARGTPKQIVFNPNNPNKPPSNGTIETYCNMVKAYANYLLTLGITDIGKANTTHAQKYIADKIACGASVFTIRQIPHALNSFAAASKTTGVFKHECRLVKKDAELAKINSLGLKRKSEDSTRLLANKEDYKKVDKELEKSSSPHAKIVRDMHSVQRHLGFRGHEVSKMQVGDLKFLAGGQMEARVQGKGGLEGFQKTADKEFIDILKGYCAGKKDSAFVFTVHSKNGNPKAHTEVNKILSQEVRAAAVRAGVDRGGKRYTAHSGRRVYAKEKMDGYKKLSIKLLLKIKDDRIKNEPNGKWLNQKYKSALTSIRDKMKDPVKRNAREMTHKELCTWLTSIDLRHGRLDIVRYYARY